MSAPATGAADRVLVSIGDARFVGRLETAAAPESAALIAQLLPIERNALHARWSGEAVWVPLGCIPPAKPEHATAYPRPGQILIYTGPCSEPELLIPYGACAFASRAGPLAGSPVITLDAAESQLRDVGERLLWNGAMTFRMERMA
jgi:hypothetical protein